VVFEVDGELCDVTPFGDSGGELSFVIDPLASHSVKRFVCTFKKDRKARRK
jgi:hypothetical protein